MTYAQTDSDAPLPHLLRRQEGPFRELDLLPIGAVLVVVLVILGARWLTRKNR